MNKSKDIFLTAQYYMKPKAHVNTSKKGWMDNPDNIRYDEQVAISRGMRDRDVNAQVVLDLSNKQVIRNRFNTEKSFDEIFRYFLDNYTQYIAQTMGQLDPDYLAEVAKNIEAEMQALPESEEKSDIQDAVINEEVKAE